MQIEQLIRDEWPLSGTCVTYLILDVLSHPLSFFFYLSRNIFIFYWLKCFTVNFKKILSKCTYISLCVLYKIIYFIMIDFHVYM